MRFSSGLQIFLLLLIAPPSHALLHFEGGASLGYGQMGDGVGIPISKVSTLGAGTFIGKRWSSFAIGAVADFAKVTDTEYLAGQDLSGTRTGLGVGLRLLLPRWICGLDWRAQVRGHFDTPSAGGQSIDYAGGGLGIILARHWSGRWGFSLKYTSDRFVSSATGPLSPPVTENIAAIGLIWSPSFLNKK